MSILSENSKKMLVESMRSYVNEVLKESTSLTSKQATEKAKFVNENATYEQLLNITMNPLRESKYLPAYVLEGAVAVLHSACMTGRKNIGPNAITEGALKLQKKTGAVITQSMIDAALTAVNEGCGLKIVGKILSELAAPQATRDALKNVDRLIANYKLNPSTDLTPVFDLYKSFGVNDPNKIADIIKNGGTRKDLNKLAQQISATKALKAGHLNRLSQANLDALHRKTDFKFADSIQKAANAPKGKTPWGKIALGVGAAGLGAAGLYKYWRNKKDMEQDRYSGTNTF